MSPGLADVLKKPPVIGLCREAHPEIQKVQSFIHGIGGGQSVDVSLIAPILFLKDVGDKHV